MHQTQSRWCGFRDTWNIGINEEFLFYFLPLSSRRPCQPGTQVHATEDRRRGHVQPSADDPDAAGGGRQRSDSGCTPSTPGVGHPSQQSSCLPIQQVPAAGGGFLTIFAATADQRRWLWNCEWEVDQWNCDDLNLPTGIFLSKLKSTFQHLGSWNIPGPSRATDSYRVLLQRKPLLSSWLSHRDAQVHTCWFRNW